MGIKCGSKGNGILRNLGKVVYPRFHGTIE